MFEYQTAISELTGAAGLERVASTRARARSPPPVPREASPTARPRVVVSRGVHPHSRETLRTTARGLRGRGRRGRRSRDGVTDLDAWPPRSTRTRARSSSSSRTSSARSRTRARSAAPAKDSPARRHRRLRPDPARHPQAAGRVRRRRRRRRGPDARQPARLRRPVVRLLRRHRGVPAAHARPHRGRDPRRRRPARLRADAADARAAHPPREGDVEHLHRAGAERARRASSISAWLGREGLVELGELLLQRTHYARETLAALDGVEPLHDAAGRARVRGPLDVGGGIGSPPCSPAARPRASTRCPARRDYPEYEDGLLVAITERRSRADIDRLADVLARAVAAERARPRAGGGRVMSQDVAVTAPAAPACSAAAARAGATIFEKGAPGRRAFVPRARRARGRRRAAPGAAAPPAPARCPRSPSPSSSATTCACRSATSTSTRASIRSARAR